MKRSLLHASFALFSITGFASSKTVDLSIEIQTGAGYTYFWQKINNKAPKNSNLLGFDASIAYAPKNSFYLQSTANGGASLGKESFSALQISAEEKMGYSINFSYNSLLIRPLLGLGYLYLQILDHSHKIRHKNTINDFYGICGLDLLFDWTSFLQTGLMFQWNPQVFASITTDSKPGFLWICHNSLGNFRGEIPFIFNFFTSKILQLKLSAFVEYIQQLDSKSETSFRKPLPEREYLLAGTSANLVWNF